VTSAGKSCLVAPMGTSLRTLCLEAAAFQGFEYKFNTSQLALVIGAKGFVWPMAKVAFRCRLK
jgi:hypothetical protein